MPPFALSESSPVYRSVKQYQDLFLVFGIIGVLVAIFVPLPTWVIDGLLVINITVAIVTLLTTIYVREPLEFSVFPSLLLVTTAFRLALNVATTRLILSDASTKGLFAAGHVIAAFGDFVAGQQPLIGFILFVIIIIVQFVVITKGANRISEVAARFTLDAMPGKQMAIDADLNAGLIRESEARERRAAISRQADFYGAMDGATKFVRGDAIAGIIITIVNILGGLIIGIVQQGMTFSDAVSVFTKLTVGDGLVSQIPALIVSIGAGLIVTRATAEGNLGSDLLNQIFSSERALFVSSLFLLGLGAFTPLPFFPLASMAVLVAFIANTLRTTGAEKVKEEEEKKVKETVKKPEKVEGLLKVDPMELEIGYGLIRLVDAAQGGDLLDRVAMIRRQLALDMGMLIPPIRIRDNMALEPNEYGIKLRGMSIGKGSLMLDHFMAMDPSGNAPPLDGVKTQEPAFGLPAVWIPASQKPRAEALGYTVVDATSVLATHLTEILKSHAAEIFTRDDVQTITTQLKETSPSLVEEVVPALLKPGEVQKVLQNLLREGVSIRDMHTILETLGDYAPRTKDSEILTEYVRNALARSICLPYQDREGRLHVVTLDPRLEDLIKASTERTETGSFLTLSSKQVGRVSQALSRELDRLLQAGHPAVVLCSPEIRLQVKRIADAVQPNIAVLSYNEVVKGIKVESVGMVSLEQGVGVA
ncbi:MAG: flagellar biosynthesis protein FlhA [Planctomycetes bacterium]|nr:flagellar biosynthesis protein FlhA [Planctomycetota bacterium]